MKMEIFFLEMERRAQNLFLTSKSAVHFIKEWDPLVLWNALASRERKFHAPSSKNVHIKCIHYYHSTHTLLLLMASKIDKKLALIAANEHSRSAAIAPPKFSDPETQIRKTTFWLEKTHCNTPNVVPISKIWLMPPLTMWWRVPYGRICQHMFVFTRNANDDDIEAVPWILRFSFTLS